MQRSDVTLQEASFHLQYEIGMVFETAHKLSEKPDIVIYNALLESFIIHTRNLVHFFYNDPLYDDIVAAHFIFGWELIRGPKSTILRQVEEEANKKVAHLTYQRFTGDYIWDIAEITHQLRQVLRLFCQKADSARLTAHFLPYVQSLVNLPPTPE